MADPESHNKNEASRRRFMRQVGGIAFSITLLDIADIAPAIARAADPDCSISQLPKPASDEDESCSVMEEDESCGDCDDNHQPDEHCSFKLPGGSVDPDEMCGHQHFIGLAEDAACAALGATGGAADSGCGVHKTSYGGTNADADQSCGKGLQQDQNCTPPGGIVTAADETCNAKTSASTTSPDETCGKLIETGTSSTMDIDEACSHYDADEGCNRPSLDEDEACGTFPGIAFDDPDGDCWLGADDQTEEPQDGPIKPWCDIDDPDYWDPPPPSE